MTKEMVREIIKENNLKSVSDVYGAIKDMFKDVLQEMLETELDETLGYDKHERGGSETNNSRNGHSVKTVKSRYGDIDLAIPRDRNGEFEPQIIPKYKRDISELDEKIIALYSRGMSTRDIHDQIKDMYGIEVSAETVSKITDKILPNIKEWQSRPLETIYPFIFMDAVHYKVRNNGQIVNKAAYVVLGVNTEGIKDVLGIWIGENESAKFWLGVLNELKNRGVEDVLFFSVDGLTGFKEAIEAVYPKAQVQRCIIHQLRNSFKYVAYKDLKAFAQDFKLVYQSPTEEIALEKLYELKEKWGKHYQYAFKSWENNWDVLSPFFKFPQDIRKIMYTTNVIEGLHRQYRKVTKTKTVFSTDSSLSKMLYLATKNVIKKWTQRYRNWDKVMNQLLILYPDRLEPYV